MKTPIRLATLVSLALAACSSNAPVDLAKLPQKRTAPSTDATIAPGEVAGLWVSAEEYAEFARTGKISEENCERLAADGTPAESVLLIKAEGIYLYHADRAIDPADLEFAYQGGKLVLAHPERNKDNSEASEISLQRAKDGLHVHAHFSVPGSGPLDLDARLEAVTEAQAKALLSAEDSCAQQKPANRLNPDLAVGEGTLVIRSAQGIEHLVQLEQANGNPVTCANDPDKESIYMSSDRTDSETRAHLDGVSIKFPGAMDLTGQSGISAELGAADSEVHVAINLDSDKDAFYTGHCQVQLRRSSYIIDAAVRCGAMRASIAGGDPKPVSIEAHLACSRANLITN
jgi:hypothetical protein